MPSELTKILYSYGLGGLIAAVLLYAVVKLFNLLMDSMTKNNRLYQKDSETATKALTESTNVLESNTTALTKNTEALVKVEKLLENAGLQAKRDNITGRSDKGK